MTTEGRLRMRQMSRMLFRVVDLAAEFGAEDRDELLELVSFREHVTWVEMESLARTLGNEAERLADASGRRSCA